MTICYNYIIISRRCQACFCAQYLWFLCEESASLFEYTYSGSTSIINDFSIKRDTGEGGIPVQHRAPDTGNSTGVSLPRGVASHRVCSYPAYHKWVAHRRGRDSNPRSGFIPTGRFSKPLPSATRPPLQIPNSLS